MLSRWPIRNKLLFGIFLLLVLVASLSGSGILGLYSYRNLVKSLSNRAAELPLAGALGQHVSDLRVTLSESRPMRERSGGSPPSTIDSEVLREQFRANLDAVRDALEDYNDQLTSNEQGRSQIGDYRQEHQAADKLRDMLETITGATSDPGWVTDTVKADRINAQLEGLQTLAGELPSYLQQRLHDLARDVRGNYRTLIIITWVTTLMAGIMFLSFIQLFYRWVFRPLRVLVKGSRRVAAGEFDHRIRLETHDEMSELAEAMNEMTVRFRTIRDDLDRQVQLRTKQVVRSEQLASVGFLAAGVAHEINNPLASIAMCAESLEGRMRDLLASDNENAPLVRQYLQMIQTEAFRCKEITEKLLDFSRMGEVKRQDTDLRELVRGVIDMVGHLGKYSQKHVQFDAPEPIAASLNGQEIKQVILNLITNALDSVDTGGTLAIELRARGSSAELLFTDNGCGMTEEVLEHLFEPFFTRKRSGQGTGLGLSIAYRIVADHDGQIEANSAGPGRGSQFRVSLPLAARNKEIEHRYQAA